MEWAVQQLVAISLVLYVVFMAKFRCCPESTLSLHGGTNLESLILATHSGNSQEEAIDATEIALKSGAVAVVISTGGILSGLAEINENLHFIPSVGGQPPRSAFGHIFSRQLGLFQGSRYCQGEQ